jgi:hypothetical protein
MVMLPKSLISAQNVSNESHIGGVFRDWPFPRIRHNALSKEPSPRMVVAKIAQHDRLKAST